MLETKREFQPIVADPDNSFLQKLTYDCRLHNIAPVTVSIRADLEQRLRADVAGCSGIFLNPKLSEPHSIALIKDIRSFCPTTPIFYIVDEAVARLPEADIQRLTVKEYLQKPFSYLELCRALNQVTKAFDGQATLGLASGDIERADVELSDQDSQFVPISAKNFVAGKESYFDVYVRLSENKYIKILQAGDAFSALRVDTYLSKNIKNFYLRKAVQESYLQYCDTLTGALLNSKTIPIDIKVAQVMNLGDQMSSYLKAQGVTESVINYARQFTKKVNTLVTDMGAHQGDAIRRHLEDNTHMDHSVSMTMIASLVATHLDFDSERCIRIVGLATMLHDIGMEELDKRFHGQDESSLSPTDLALFHSHPIIGREMLRQIPRMEPIVLQAVGQHHERRNGHGYPFQLGSGSINLVSEIIGISEEFVNRIAVAQKNPGFDVLHDMELKCFAGFSASVVSSFKLFFGKK